MPLTRNEVNELITKLREKYRDYSAKYSPVWFDINAFDQRLNSAINGRMNMEGFILAEISNFEKIKERYDKKRKQKENSFSREVDKILEENIARIKKYPGIMFHQGCGIEISHLYGALSHLSDELFPVFRLIIDDNSIKKRVFDFEESLDFLAHRRGVAHPKRITDHILLLNRAGIREIEIEKDSNDYLKESAFLLHEIIDFCDGLIDSGNDELNYPVTFQKLFIEDDKKKKIVENFRNVTGYGAVLKIRDYISEIIEDFRLKAFRKTG